MKKILSIITLLFFVVPVSAEQQALDNAQIKPSTSDLKPTQMSDIKADTSKADSVIAEAKEQSGISQGSVTRSIFTTEVAEHEPIDKIEKLNLNHNSVFYFTELHDMSGQTAIHRWEFNGNVMAETKFNVAGPRWRVWSSKNLLPSWTGEWKVSVLNGVGDVISEDVFSYMDEVSAATNTQLEGTTKVQASPPIVENKNINDMSSP